MIHFFQKTLEKSHQRLNANAPLGNKQVPISSTRREIDFYFLLDYPESDCIYFFPFDFGTKRHSVWFQIYRLRCDVFGSRQ